jgi:hypothetical protein
VSLTDRDRKIVLIIAPVVLVIAYWFLLLGPKRSEVSKAGDELSKQEQQLGAARQQDQQLAKAKSGFTSGYAEMVRLGKAVPASLDMPSLLVQLDTAAHGTGIRFSRIATGSRTAAGTAGGASTGASSGGSSSGSGGSSSGSSGGSQPASAAGGAKAQTGYGKATEKAHENANATSQGSNAAANANPDTSTSSQSGKGGLPVGGGSATPSQGGGGAGAQTPPGLDTMPLELTFEGNFYNLADFFHRLKRFVRVFNSQVVVRGRLMTVESLKYSSDPEIFPKLKAELTATVYLSPATQGATAGASPQGPGSSTEAASTSQGGSSGGGSAPAPAATTKPPAP